MSEQYREASAKRGLRALVEGVDTANVRAVCLAGSGWEPATSFRFEGDNDQIAVWTDPAASILMTRRVLSVELVGLELTDAG